MVSVQVDSLLSSPVSLWGLCSRAVNEWQSTIMVVQEDQKSNTSRSDCQQMINLFSTVQSLSHVQLFATPWTAARQAFLSITNFCSLLRLMSIELVMPSNQLIPFSSCLHSFPASGSFPMSQIFASGGQSIWVSASASALAMNIQDWLPLGWTGWISLQSKGLSRVFSNTTFQHMMDWS